MKDNSVINDEIIEQPKVIHAFLDQETEHVFQIAQTLRGKFQYIIIAARGSSDNAARYAQYLFGAYNRLQVALATPSLFSMYKTPPNMEGALVIGISQSGQSPDIVSVLEEANRQNRPTLSITNDPQSPLAQASKNVIPLHTGKEKAIAATKTYTCSLAALALLSCTFAGDTGRLFALKAIPSSMEEVIENKNQIAEKVARYRYMEHCAVIGRGFNYSTAFEVALKIKELTRVVAEPYSSADFRHGPIATISPGFPVFLIAPSGAITPDLQNMTQELAALKAETIIVSDDPAILSLGKTQFPIPTNIPEWLTPLIAVIPGQIFAMQLAIERGLDPDVPEGLTKVTETY